MKNFGIRTFVLALALTGIASTSFMSSVSARNASVAKSTIQVQTSMVSTPTPMCPPNQPDGCGIL